VTGDTTGSGSASAAATGAGDDVGAQITVVGGNPTATEVAAVTAVLAATLEELRGREAAAKTGPVVSAWQRTQRPLRGTLVAGAGQWRGFLG
jgi:hypothetical protein